MKCFTVSTAKTLHGNTATPYCGVRLRCDTVTHCAVACAFVVTYQVLLSISMCVLVKAARAHDASTYQVRELIVVNEDMTFFNTHPQ